MKTSGRGTINSDDGDDFDKLARHVVAIDELKLDRECVRLPTDYLKFAHAAADAKRAVDELKLELDTVEAEVSNSVRLAPDHYGVEKVTESAINSAVAASPKVRKAQRALIEAKHASEVRQAVVWALEHKKRTLTLLVELHGMGYFASPKVSEKGKRAIEEMERRHDIRRKRHDDD